MRIQKKFYDAFFNKKLIIKSFLESLFNINPRHLFQNPVLFILLICTCYLFLSGIYDLFFSSFQGRGVYALVASFWFSFCIFISNFSESIGKKACETILINLKNIKDVPVDAYDVKKRLFKKIPISKLKINDVVSFSQDDTISVEGELIEGQGYIDESSITGQSTPVLYEKEGKNRTVKPGCILLSDKILVRITKSPNVSKETHQIIKEFVRHKSPLEINVDIFIGFQIISTLIMCTIIKLFESKYHVEIDNIQIVILFCALLPTTIGGLLNSIGIRSVYRIMKQNMIVKSLNVVEKAGQLDVILFDKTGTLTYGTRRTLDIIPIHVTKQEAIEAAYAASLYDETQEGKSILKFIRNYDHEVQIPKDILKVFEFSSETKISGCDFEEGSYRKGDVKTISEYIRSHNGTIPPDVFETAMMISNNGDTPLALVKDNKIIGIIHFEDSLKPEVEEDIKRIKEFGVTPIMITGDNELTAKKIARDLDIEEWYGGTTPQDKIRMVEKLQTDNQTVGMCGDGFNDLEALGEADVGMAMRKGNSLSCEAANVIDLSSHPGKMADLIEIGRQQLLTRGALLTFSTASDIVKYAIIFNMIFIDFYDSYGFTNFLHLHSFQNVLMSIVIFDAFIIFFLIPKIAKGIRLLYSTKQNDIISHEIFINGTIGFIITILGIKAIDMVLSKLIFLTY